MPAMMMGTRNRKSVKRYKRKDKLWECGEGELQFNGEFLLLKSLFPIYLPPPGKQKRQQTIPHASLV
jgi:hypothetical protein